MLIARSLADLPGNLSRSSVAIGNFDGVHRGHQGVLDKAVEIAKKASMPAIMLTFEPHPRSFFNPAKPVFRLTGAPMKAELAAALGFDIVFEQAFNADFAALSADRFIDELLFEGLKAEHIITGHDFHFGKGRTGTPHFLQQRASQSGRHIDLVEPIRDENGVIISSSRVRQALAQGELAEANALLGYVWRIRGVVVDGQKIGRTIGYPTANIELPEEASLAHGIYAVRVERADGSLHDAVASFGRRPTFDNGKALFETFLFDFDGDLYGEELTIYLYCRLRDELKFDSVAQLVQQMDVDTNEARAFLATIAPEKGKWPPRGQ